MVIITTCSLIHYCGHGPGVNSKSKLQLFRLCSLLLNGINQKDILQKQNNKLYDKQDVSGLTDY